MSFCEQLKDEQDLTLDRSLSPCYWERGNHEVGHSFKTGDLEMSLVDFSLERTWHTPL